MLNLYKPTVSIGLPVFNGGDYLRFSIDSILEQTFTDFELIISDNASSDSTQKICEEYARRDKRIVYTRFDENKGATINYNHIVNTARGKYFKWAAHDDICKPTYIAKCVKALDENKKVILAYPQTTIIDGAGKYLHDFDDGLHLISNNPVERYKQFHRRFRTPAECNAVFGLIRTDVLRRTALIGNYPGSDKVLLAELALHGCFSEIPERLFLRRDHENTSLRANPGYEDRAEWFDPAKRNTIIMATWRWFAEYYRAISRSPLSLGAKLSCYQETNRWAWFAKKTLLDEIKTTIKILLCRTRLGSRLLYLYRRLRDK
jgi:glycosyltransferase involved in cell wall biosynthesis